MVHVRAAEGGRVLKEQTMIPPDVAGIAILAIIGLLSLSKTLRQLTSRG